MDAVKGLGLPPLTLLGVAVSLFGFWLAHEAAHESVQQPEGRYAPSHPPEWDARPAPHNRPIEGSLGFVRVGCPMSLVERHLGALPTPESEPTPTKSESPLVKVRVPLQLTRPVPHLMRDFPSLPFHPGRYVLVMDFDGAAPAHLLVRAELVPGQ